MSKSKKNPPIRVIALAVIRDADRLFLSRGWDPAARRHFWRPLGGGVEFGERSAEALKREFREEIDQSIEILSPAVLFENLFTFNGSPGHEIILMHEARFVDDAMLTVEPFSFAEPGPSGSEHLVQWMSLDQLRAGSEPLFPEGLLNYIERF